MKDEPPSIHKTEAITINTSLPQSLFEPKEEEGKEGKEEGETIPPPPPELTTTINTTLVKTLSIVAVLGAMLVFYLLK